MSLDWAELFRFSVAPAELVVRGTAMYLFLFALFRIVIKRRVGTIIDRGKVLRRNLRIEYVSEDELKAKLRERGVSGPAQVEKAYLESDGEVTVIRRRDGAR